MKKNIPTFIINLKKRTDRKCHAFKEFNKKSEFNLQIINAIENKNGALGLWSTIKHIIENLVSKDESYILICEDDHQFTKHYSNDFLFSKIVAAKEKDADVLLGGVSWFSDVLEVSDDLFWVDQFTGLQFAIIFRKFFRNILEAKFMEQDVADRKIADLTPNKFLIYPFISIQKEFGYSDVTIKNNKEGYVTQIFEKASMVLNSLNRVKQFYKPNLYE